MMCVSFPAERFLSWEEDIVNFLVHLGDTHFDTE